MGELLIKGSSIMFYVKVSNKKFLLFEKDHRFVSRSGCMMMQEIEITESEISRS